MIQNARNLLNLRFFRGPSTRSEQEDSEKKARGFLRRPEVWRILVTLSALLPDARVAARMKACDHPQRFAVNDKKSM